MIQVYIQSTIKVIHSDNPGKSSRLKILNLIITAKSFLATKGNIHRFQGLGHGYHSGRGGGGGGVIQPHVHAV